jgi:hypothetical protein
VDDRVKDYKSHRRVHVATNESDPGWREGYYYFHAPVKTKVCTLLLHATFLWPLSNIFYAPLSLTCKSMSAIIEGEGGEAGEAALSEGWRANQWSLYVVVHSLL